jgi:hypothetical protein
MAAQDGEGMMLTRSATATIFDNGGACVELRQMPDGRWTVATGMSVIATGKTPWMAAARTIVPTREAAVALFLAALPDDPALRAHIGQEIG